MRRDVHTIIEEVALKEIEQDPVGFLKREARREVDMPVDSCGMSQSGDLWLNISGEEEKKEEEFNLVEKDEDDSDSTGHQVSQSVENIVPKLLSHRDNSS